MARDIERKLNLPQGWMDRDHREASPDKVAVLPIALSDTAIRLARAIEKLPPDIQDCVKALAEHLASS